MHWRWRNDVGADDYQGRMTSSSPFRRGQSIPLSTIMAPDRGSASTGSGPQYHSIPAEDDIHKTGDDPNLSDNEDSTANEEADAQDETRRFLADRAAEAQNFTLRGVLVGLAIGVIICFSNMYFGLQTGWVSGMAMPAALIGFAFFKSVAKYIDYPFTPVENVLVQTVAGAVGTMPLGCGFVGVLPALNYLLKPEEGGPLVLGTGKLIIWALGICLFGVFIAVPLRKEVIIREKLKFPSGTATALMIGVLHGDTEGEEKGDPLETFQRRSEDMSRREMSLDRGDEPRNEEEVDKRSDWKGRIKLLIIAFAVSAVYVRCLPLSCIYHCSDSTDTDILFHPSPPRHPHLRPPPRPHLALDLQPLPRLHRPRHHHGSRYNPPHAPWRHRRLVYPLPPRQNPRLGARPRRKLGERQQRLDSLGQPGDHARRLRCQPWLADPPPHYLLYAPASLRAPLANPKRRFSCSYLLRIV